MAKSRSIEQAARLANSSLLDQFAPSAGTSVSEESLRPRQEQQDNSLTEPEAPVAAPAEPTQPQPVPIQQPQQPIQAEAPLPQEQSQPSIQTTQTEQPESGIVAPSIQVSAPLSTEQREEEPVQQDRQVPNQVPQEQPIGSATAPQDSTNEIAPTTENDINETEEVAFENRQYAAAQLRQEKEINYPSETQYQSSRDTEASAPDPVSFPESKQPVLTTEPNPSPARTVQPRRRATTSDQRNIGSGVQRTLTSNADLSFHEVGLGESDIENLFNDPDSTFLPNILQSNGLDAGVASISELINLINSSNVEVACYKKSGSNSVTGINKRTLRIVKNNGISLHPAMATMYDATFGDDFVVTSDPRVTSVVRDAVGDFLNLAGKPMINLDYWPTFMVNADNEQKYITALYQFLSDDIVDDGDRSRFARLAVNMCRDYANGDRDKADKDLQDLLAHTSRISNGNLSLISSAIRKTYEAMRVVRFTQTAQTNSIASVVPVGTDPRIEPIQIQANLNTARMSASEYIQSRILREVGFPKQYQSFDAWYEAFSKSMKRYSSIISIADSQWNTEMQYLGADNSHWAIDFNDVSKSALMSRMAEAFHFVYKDFTLSRVFDENTFFSENMNDQELNAAQAFWFIHSGSTIDSIYRTSSALTDNAVEDKNVVSLLYYMVRSRIEKARKYDTSMYRDVANNLLQSIKYMNVSGHIVRDPDLLQSTYETQIDLLRTMGPELFNYFNMNDIDGFFSSKYGKALLNAKDRDSIGGIRLAMLAEYRMSRINNAASRIGEDDYSKSSTIYAHELSMLENSSMIWGRLLYDYAHASTIYLELIDAEAIPQNASGYLSAIDYLLDENIGYEDKISVCEALCNSYEFFDDTTIEAQEIAYQLEQNAYPAQPMQEPGTDSLTDMVRTSMDAYNGFDFTSHIGEEVGEYDRVYIEQNKELVESYLFNVWENPYLAYRINDDIFADALCSTLAGEAYDGEGLHPYTQAFYSMVSDVYNGGVDSDSSRVTDTALGFIDVKNISPRNLVQIFSGRSDLQAYDSNGDLLVVEDTTDMMFNHQYISAHCFSSCVVDQTKNDGSVIFCRQRSIAGSVENFRRLRDSGEFSAYSQMAYAKNTLVDHPTYNALVALLNATNGKSSRSLRREYINTNNNLCKLFCYWAVEYNKDNDMLNNLQNELNDRLGISQASIKAALLKNPEVHEGETFGLSDGTEWTVDEFADNLYGVILRVTSDYITELSVIADVDTVHNVQYITPSSFSMDFESCVNFFDVRNALNNAKYYAKESNDDSDNMPLAFILGRKDKYISPIDLTSADLDVLIEANANSNLGPLGEVNFAALSYKDVDDLVIEIPEGADIRTKDNTTDSRGNQIQTLETWFSIKRSDPYSNKNLKESKYGCDDMDSITRSDHSLHESLLRSRNYRTDRDPEVIKEDLWNPYGIFFSRYNLAKLLKEENEKLGYSDLSLAQFMNLADIMLIENGEDDICLRPLGLVMNAIRSRITPSQVDELSLEELRSITNDVVDNFIPAPSNRNFLTNTRSLPLYNVKGKVTAKKMAASHWQSDFDVVEELANRSNSDLRSDAAGLERSIMDSHKQDASLFRALKSSMTNGSMIIDDFSSSSYAGYNYIGGQYVRALLQKGDKERITNGLREAWMCGNTVAVRADLIDEYIPDIYKKDLTPLSSLNGRVFVLPFFDIRRNELEKNLKPEQFKKNPNEIILTYEDSSKELNLGENEVRIFNNLSDRVNFTCSGDTSIQMSDLFSDTINSGLTVRNYSLASYPEVMRLIVERRGNGITIDYSSVKGRNKKMITDRLIKKFAEGNIDDNGFATEAKAGEIVAWAQANVVIDGVDYYVLAPIIPFAKDRKIGDTLSPSTVCSISNVSFDNYSINIQWIYEGGIDDANLLLSNGPGCDTMVVNSSSQHINGPMLENGFYLDVATNVPSPRERMNSRNRRLETMETLMYIARMQGYNFANAPTSFPNDDPDDQNSLKYRLLHGYVSADKWEQILSDPNFKFSSDADLDIFLKTESRKFLDLGWNPTDFLASGYYVPTGRRNGEIVSTKFVSNDVYWEFGTTFRATTNYQDMLLKFFNAVDPTLCPAGIEEDYNGELFRVCDDMGYNNRCLQMSVPHKVNGSVVRSFENVYARFISSGNGYSGLGKSHASGSNSVIDALNAMAMTMQEPESVDWKSLLRKSLSDNIDAKQLSTYIEILPN